MVKHRNLIAATLCFSVASMVSQAADFQQAPLTLPTIIKLTGGHRWISIATARWNDINGRARSAVGFAEGQSASAASAEAIRQCQERGGRGCATLGTYDNGCFFVTIGVRSGSVSIGTGSTRQRSIENCENEGYICQKPIGGCV
ncbi:DUF4189 domain-containing protein [Methylocystis iwaonis]|uniref:DUF4189 domain-containing protein n=1 Tax=Methylocystis iwaonis TaxID=2885079 RepID=UPI003313BCF2